MKKLYSGFCKLEETICCIGFLIMIGLVFLSAVARTAGHPLAWSIDVSQLLLCWTTLIGADIAFRYKKFLVWTYLLQNCQLKCRGRSLFF